VLRQLLEQWTNRLRDAQHSAALAEHTVRLLMFAVSLLGQHRVNERGRCQFCSWSRWRWPFWHRRPQCTVCRALVFAMGQNLDVVWWQLLTNLDKKISLVDVREWMTQREQQACSALLAEHNPAAPWTPPPEQAGPAMTDAPSPSPDLPSSPATDEPG
jgi:hypothetical protein